MRRLLSLNRVVSANLHTCLSACLRLSPSLTLSRSFLPVSQGNYSQKVHFGLDEALIENALPRSAACMTVSAAAAAAAADGVSRPPGMAKACHACHRAKRRCGKQTPDCGRCRKKGIECTYPASKPTCFVLCDGLPSGGCRSWAYLPGYRQDGCCLNIVMAMWRCLHVSWVI